MSMILSLREGEILGLQPSDLDFDAADGRGTISVSKTMQRANKDALEKLDPNQVYHTFPDRREGSKSSLILKKPKTKKSNRVLYMTKPLKEELLAWLGKAEAGRAERPGKVQQLRAAVPAPGRLAHCTGAADQVVPPVESQSTRSLSRSCSTVCGTPVPPTSSCSRMATSSRCRATPAMQPPPVLMDTYAHTQDKPRLELTEKIEANFYSQDLTPAAPQPRQNEKPVATKISGKEILEAIRLMDADERRELTRALFA